MYCRNCGKEVTDDKELCSNCEPKEELVIEEVKEEKKEDAKQEEVKTETVYTAGEQKSKIAAGLFAIFLGAFGVHNFYLGYTGKAVAQLLITVLTCGILSFVSAIWGFIEGILILSEDASYSKDAKGVPLKE